MFAGKTFEARPPKVDVARIKEEDLKTLYYLLTEKELSVLVYPSRYGERFETYNSHNLTLDKTGIIVDVGEGPRYLIHAGDHIIFGSNRRCEVLPLGDREVTAEDIPARWKENAFVKVSSQKSWETWT